MKTLPALPQAYQTALYAGRRNTSPRASRKSEADLAFVAMIIVTVWILLGPVGYPLAW